MRPSTASKVKKVFFRTIGRVSQPLSRQRLYETLVSEKETRPPDHQSPAVACFLNLRSPPNRVSKKFVLSSGVRQQCRTRHQQLRIRQGHTYHLHTWTQPKLTNRYIRSCLHFTRRALVSFMLHWHRPGIGDEHVAVRVWLNPETKSHSSRTGRGGFFSGAARTLS